MSTTAVPWPGRARGAWAAGALALLHAIGCALALQPPDPTELRLQDGALDLWIERTVRLQRVADRVRSGARALCGERLAAQLGVALLRVKELPPEQRGAAIRRFGSQDRLWVLAVLAGSPAERADLRVGDALLSWSGRALLRVGDAEPRAAQADPARLRILRGTGEREVVLTPELGCASLATLRSGTQFDARADGSSIFVESGLLRFVERDEGLAWVIGHELAHNLQRWRGGSVPGVRAEARADYLGTYLAVRAGYALQERDLALLEVAQSFPGELGDAGPPTHPSGSERLLAYRKALAEIELKQSHGRPLLPEQQ